MIKEHLLSQVNRRHGLSLLGMLVLIGLALDAFSAQGATAESSSVKRTASQPAPLHTYALAQDGSPGSYDEAMAVACLQGIINRKSPDVYVLSRKNSRPQYWLEVLSKDGRWLQGREVKPLRT